MTKPKAPKTVTLDQLRILRARFKESSINRFHSRRNPELRPLQRPLQSVLLGFGDSRGSTIISGVFQHVLRTKRSYAVWAPSDWANCFHRFKHDRKGNCAHGFILLAYRFTGAIIVDQIYGTKPKVRSVSIAEMLYGSVVVKNNINTICDTLVAIGYKAGSNNVASAGAATVAEMMLMLNEPHVHKWKGVFPRVQSVPRHSVVKKHIHAISIALVSLGIIERPVSERSPGFAPHNKRDPYARVAPEWLRWCDRWFELSTHEVGTKRRILRQLRHVGRWLCVEHPSITSPAQWDMRLAAKFVATVCNWKVGDYIDDMPVNIKRTLGEELKPNSKVTLLADVRTFFRNLQELELIRVRFNPSTSLKNPRSITSQTDWAPRPLADDVWAKLLYAGVNLRQQDIPKAVNYPLELIRAVAINWLFDGLRNDELHRLQVGCVEREPSVIDLTSGEVKAPVCELLVPANKYKGAFKKPVDPIVADAIEAWERVRPAQPPMLDRKTRRLTHRLFAFRGKPVGKMIINQRIIPLLCRLAGVPREDAIGRITSHRARSTIASQLFNADHPMGLLDLMEWLGHKKPDSVLAYAKANRKKMARAYASADYFKRNVGRITVLLDREAIESGEAARGKAYMNYDLGHGYCQYNFFSQCPHRMACIRCSFYLSKNSGEAQLLEAGKNNQRFIEEVPLREAEIEAAKGDGLAIAELAKKLRFAEAPDGTVAVPVAGGPNGSADARSKP